MHDLIAFMQARLAEARGRAEAAAKEAYPGFGDNDGTHWESINDGDVHCFGKPLAVGPYECDMAEQISRHIVAHDPARVLADIAAKEALVTDYLVVAANNLVERANGADKVKLAAGELIAKTLRMALRRLAVAYDAHPDFKPEWRIDA